MKPLLIALMFLLPASCFAQEKNYEVYPNGYVKVDTIHIGRLGGVMYGITFFPDTIKLDPHYWNHIRNKNGRLQIIKLDTTVYAKVISVYNQDDGDLHFWMRTLPDSNYLVGEIICYQYRPQCGRYKNHVKRPHVGNFVRVKGDYVRDRQHKWNEIHPVKKALVLKRKQFYQMLKKLKRV